MSEFTLTRTQIRAGLYQGTLTAASKTAKAPEIELRLLDSDLCTAVVTPDPDKARTWNLRAKIPQNAISEGVQTFLLRDAKSGETLDSFAIVAGDPLQDDLRVEIALLRGELELLKEVFRRQYAGKER